MNRLCRAGLCIIALAGCSARGGLTEYSPEQAVQPDRAFARGDAQVVRFVTTDGAVLTLYRARLVGDTVIGTRDAGPPRRVPTDSIAYVEAFSVDTGGVGAGEWFRIGLLAAFIGAMGLCAAGNCSP